MRNDLKIFVNRINLLALPFLDTTVHSITILIIKKQIVNILN